MNSNLINISEIESFFDDLLRGSMSDNVFAGDLPPTIDATWNDMVVIDCATTIIDFNAFGRGIVFIRMYAKPLSSGAKNVKVLSALEEKLNAALQSNKNNHYIVSRNATYQDYDSTRKLHCNIAFVNILVK